jgi:hypothetical protein
MAAGSLQRIGAETGADDTAETAEKESTSKESVLKASPSNASPSNAEIKDNRGESGTSKAEAGADADTGKAEAGADADTGKAEAGAESGANKAEAGANGAITGTEAGINGAPNGTATGAKIEAFLGLDEAIAVQKLSLGAKESDIILPDTLEVRMKQETLEDAPKAEGKLQIDAEERYRFLWHPETASAPQWPHPAPGTLLSLLLLLFRLVLRLFRPRFLLLLRLHLLLLCLHLTLLPLLLCLYLHLPLLLLCLYLHLLLLLLCLYLTRHGYLLFPHSMEKHSTERLLIQILLT